MNSSQMTAKELMYLEDVMSMEASEVQKYQQAAQNAIDPQAKSLFTSVAQQHQNHFNMFRQHVEKASGK